MSHFMKSLALALCIMSATGCKVIRARRTASGTASTSIPANTSIPSAGQDAGAARTEIDQASYERFEANAAVPALGKLPSYSGGANLAGDSATPSSTGSFGATKRC
jgi:hypothetical protein